MYQELQTVLIVRRRQCHLFV